MNALLTMAAVNTCEYETFFMYQACASYSLPSVGYDRKRPRDHRKWEQNRLNRTYRYHYTHYHDHEPNKC